MADQNQDDLESRFAITEILADSFEHEVHGNVERSILRFNLSTLIPDADHRARMVKGYRMALEELAPTLVERLKKPLIYADEESKRKHEAATQKAINDAMDHIASIWDGSHRWCELMKQNPSMEDSEARLHATRVYSAVNVVLEVEHYEPGKQLDRTAVFFAAALFDTSTAVNGKMKPLEVIFGPDT